MSFGTGSTGLALILQSIHELNIFTDHCVFACVFGGTYPLEQLASSGLPVRSTKRLSFTLATGEQFSSFVRFGSGSMFSFSSHSSSSSVPNKPGMSVTYSRVLSSICADQLGYSASQESQHPSWCAQECFQQQQALLH